jgi:NADH-ubiquinone oxidoreductase chain 4
LIASVFVLGEFCESVFYFVFRKSGVVNFSELFGRGHSFEQEVYLFDVPGVFTSWTDGVPFGGWEVVLGGDSISELLNLLLNFLSVILLFLPGDSLDDNLSQSTIFVFFQTLLTVCFSVLDILVFFIFFELMVIPMFLFFAFFSTRERRSRAYWYFFFYTVIGSVPFLLGIFYLRDLVGSTSYNVIEAHTISYADQCIL